MVTLYFCMAVVALAAFIVLNLKFIAMTREDNKDQSAMKDESTWWALVITGCIFAKLVGDIFDEVGLEPTAGYCSGGALAVILVAWCHIVEYRGKRRMKRTNRSHRATRKQPAHFVG